MGIFTSTVPFLREPLTTTFAEDAGLAKIWNISSTFLEFLNSVEGFTVTSQYKKFITATKNLSLILSIQSTFLNFLLILNLLLDKEFRTWQFYPIIFQIFCDLQNKTKTWLENSRSLRCIHFFTIT